MSNGIKVIAQVLENHGFTPVAAAGIIGNAYQESSWNPSSIGDGGGGLWGFTASPNSLADLYHYAASTGQNWRDPRTQTRFLVQHISGSTKSTLNSIKDPAAAASYFMNNWEHPLASTENEGRRQQGAQIAYHQISGADLGSAGNKQVAQGRSMGSKTTSKTATSNQTISDPGVTTRTTAGGGPDYKGALLAALETPTPINVDGTLPTTSLLDKFQANVASGAYTTPVTNTILKSAGQSTTFSDTTTNKTIARGRAGGASSTPQTTNPSSIAKSKPYGALSVERTDQGLDFGGAGPVRAIANGVVLRVGSWSGWPNADGAGVGVVYKTSLGNVYVMETFKAAAGLKVGDKIRQGQVIGRALGPVPGSTGIETGFANAAGTGPLTPYNGAADGTPMPSAIRFRKLLGY